jgi:hypothetical protein
MIQLFRCVLGASSRGCAAKKIAPNPKPRTAAGAIDYRAVSIDLCPHCQAAAKELAGKRYLLRDAPRLPLSRGAPASGCSCKFRKHPDRRDSDRRLLGETETHRWFAGSERRLHSSRRSVRAERVR